MASKDNIKRQIAALQAKLAEAPESPPAKRRRTIDATVLAPATPSPRKKTAIRDRAQSPTDLTRRTQPTRTVPCPTFVQKPVAVPNTISKQHNRPETTAQSDFISQLKALNVIKSEDCEPVGRTDGFEETPALPPTGPEAVKIPVRDERLAIVEDLELGPIEHKSIADDRSFEKIEPNSGIRLKERVLLHTSLQEHLTGRYFLPPSLLYSVVRLQANKQAYDVPVEGDWVTIAVVAERGDVKFTCGPGNSTYKKRSEEEDDNLFDKKSSKEKNRRRKKDEDDEDGENPKKGGKKFVHLKLIDLGHRSRSSSSADGQKGALRGDAQLSLLLFESDYFDKLIDKNGGKKKVRKMWRGGSGGAFEECFPRLREGTVVALLNPKVLKPFTSSRNPSPTSSILALTPPSASAIAVIGYAADLGRCTVQRRDGKPCGSWVDRRVTQVGTSSKHTEDVCEYHIQTAVQRARAGRAEFSAGTSGMSTTAHKRKPAYDAVRQWGLKPETASRGTDGEATYVVGGLVASSSRAYTLGNVGDSMGREEQARARRKAGAQEDKVLSELLGKDKSGTGSGGGDGASREALAVVNRARDAMLKAREHDLRGSKAKKRGEEMTSLAMEENVDGQPRRKTYSAEMVKCLGFDPTAKSYSTNTSGARPKKSDATNKLASQNHEIRLGPPPGPKVRSGVVAPPLSTEPVSSITQGAKLTSSVITKAEIDSDSDLEIEPPSPRTLEKEEDE